MKQLIKVFGRRASSGDAPPNVRRSIRSQGNVLIIRALRENWSKFAAFIALAAGTTFLIAYFSQEMLAPPVQPLLADGGYADYYRAVAQYQLQLERLCRPSFTQWNQ